MKRLSRKRRQYREDKRDKENIWNAKFKHKEEVQGHIGRMVNKTTSQTTRRG